MYPLRRIIIIVLTLLPWALRAQHRVDQPEILLVQLSTEQNRRNMLMRGTNPRLLEQLNRDMSAIYRVIRNDFRDHFTFCPVYYFLDTDLVAVRAGQYTNFIKDSAGKTVPSSVVNGKEVLLAVYGYAHQQMPPIGHIRDKEGAHSFDTRKGRRWVVYDTNMDQVAYTPVQITTRGDKWKSGADKRWYYRSPRFDIEYHPCAADLAATLYDLAPR